MFFYEHIRKLENSNLESVAYLWKKYIEENSEKWTA